MVAEEALDAEIEQLVKVLLANSPQAVAHTKALVHFVADRPADLTTQDYTTDLIAKIRVSAEGQEGLSAFFAKRSPKWQ